MHPSSEREFLRIAERGNLIPVYEELSASFETPLSIYLKIKKGRYSFLLESVERGVQLGRYSFIGSDPYLVFRARGSRVTLTENGETSSCDCADPLEMLEEIFQRHQAVEVPELTGFSGGAVGYLGYEMVRFFEKLPPQRDNEDSPADCVFMFTGTLVIYDHVRQVIRIVVNVRAGENPAADYAAAVMKIEEIKARLRSGLSVDGHSLSGEAQTPRQPREPQPNMTEEEFCEMVRVGKEYIKAGDIFQVVLSQRFSVKLDTDPLLIYRNLRSINPSPYMFFLEIDDLHLVGSSPEILVKVGGREAEVRPIAGTRPRGADEAREKVLEIELAADEKEKAEHLMLVDLGRNDLGRVCGYGSVKLERFMEIEKYSHVMHLVSHVKGTLKPGISNFDVLRATFPAGTVSGAPKIRAMEIIAELEPTARGPYAGAVGYIGYNGEMDTCITIRTIIIRNGWAYIQAGAGIVADSDPEAEYLECKNKARALFKAIETAERG